MDTIIFQQWNGYNVTILEPLTFVMALGIHGLAYWLPIAIIIWTYKQLTKFK